MRFVFSGPESCGKTTLAQLMHDKTAEPLVTEVARPYLKQSNGKYDLQDLFQIALLQRWEEITLFKGKKHIICDTDILTVLIWQFEKYGSINEHMLHLWQDQVKSIHFLCFPDIPWVYDPLREHPNDRQRLFDVYKRWLDKYKFEYIILKGSINERMVKVLDTYDTKIRSMNNSEPK